MTCLTIYILQLFPFIFLVGVEKAIQILLYTSKPGEMLQILLKEQFILEKLYNITSYIIKETINPHYVRMFY